MKCFLVIFHLLASLSVVTAQTLRGMYVDGFAAILGNTAAEDQLLNYAQQNNINYLALYDLWPVHQQYDLTNPNTCTVLANFIERAHNLFGITQIGATGENLWFFQNVINPYQQTHANANQRFDVYNVEFEFWNTPQVEPGGYYCTTYLSPAGTPCSVAGASSYWLSMIGLVNTAAHENNAISEVYVGWFDQALATQFAHAVDRILLHDYVTNEAALFPYISQRLQYLATGPTPTQVAVLFSSEPEFLGPYLQTNPITQPFDVVDGLFNDLDASWTQNINLIGWQWFAYSFMPQNTVGVRQLQPKPALSVWPNPAFGMVNVSIDGALSEENWSFTLTDLAGRVLVGQSAANGTATISTSVIESGVYMLNAVGQNRALSVPISIQN